MSAHQPTKTCTKCNRTLPISEFWREWKGKFEVKSCCKECTKAMRRESANGKRKNDPEWRRHEHEMRKKWIVTPAGKRYLSRRAAKRDQYKAHGAVYSAVRSGKISNTKELRCEKCDGPAVVYHHYLGYAKEHQLDVQPLCKMCHCAVHAEMSPSVALPKLATSAMIQATVRDLAAHKVY